MAQINKPDEYFNTKLYTGNGSSQSITGVGFQPDWVWTKKRSAGEEHIIYDSVRGVYKYIKSDGTDAESNVTTSLTSFDSDGFTLGSSWNTSGATYASWNWLASNTTASNTDGSITSTVSANTTSGFSIVSYTGTGSVATVGHGLGTAPAMVIVKNRDATSTWITFHKSLPNTNAVFLNLTNASTSGGTGYWNNTSPTSSVFSIGTDTANNVSGNNHIAYCFAEKKGFSKFGSYTGNGNADGTFIYTGFKPAFVMTKCTTTDTGYTWWGMFDNKRIGYNSNNYRLFANNSNAEDTTANEIDILSNGFKCRSTSSTHNISGQTFIYMAFAESPLVGTNNTPATAR